MLFKRSRITIALSLVMAALVGFGGLAAPVLTDVSRDHWAYQAVMGLVDKGYLSVYNDGSFRGDEPVSRYLLAFVVAKMLTDLEKGTISATDEDMAVLRQVSNELRGELVPLIAALDTRLKAVEGASNENVRTITAERQERKAEAAVILDDLEEQAKLVTKLGESMIKTEVRIVELEKAMAVEAAAERKLIDALKVEGEAGRAASEAAITELKASQLKTEAALSALNLELGKLRASLSDDIARSVAQLTLALNAEAAQRKKLEQEGVENLAAALANVKAAAEAEAAAERVLIEAVRKESTDGRAALTAAVEDLRKALGKTDARVDEVNRELAVIKAALGQDIEKAVSELSVYLDRESQGRKELEAKLEQYAKASKQELDQAAEMLESSSRHELDTAVEQLRQWADEQHGLMAEEFDDKLGEISSGLSMEIGSLSAKVFAEIDYKSKEADAKLAAASQALKAYSDEETRARALADDETYAKMAELEAKLGANLEKAISQTMAAIEAQKTAGLASEAKLVSELAKLKTTMMQEDDNIREMVLRNAIELQDKDAELQKKDKEIEASIAALRVLMDEARIGIAQLKDRIAAVEGRIAKLETSVDVLKSNLESTANLLVSVNNELSRQKVLQGTLETRLADLSASTEAKFKKMDLDNITNIEAMNLEAQEREGKLQQEIQSLQRSLAKQAEDLNAELKKAKGLGITGIILGSLGLVAGIIALILAATP